MFGDSINILKYGPKICFIKLEKMSTMKADGYFVFILLFVSKIKIFMKKFCVLKYFYQDTLTMFLNKMCILSEFLHTCSIYLNYIITIKRIFSN